MAHYHGKHGVDENLIGDNTRNQRAAMVLVLLLLPVAPGNGVSGKAGVPVLENHAVAGCLGNVDGLPSVDLFLRVKIAVEGFAVLIAVVGKLGAAALTCLKAVLTVGGNAVFLSCLPAEIFHGIAANDEYVGLALHIGGVGIAEHYVHAVHKLHADLAPICAEAAAVGHCVRVPPEVGTVVAGLRAIEQRLAHAVVHFELLKKVRHLRRSEACVFVALPPGEGLEADGHGAGGQRGHKKAHHSLYNVENRLGQAVHCGCVGHVYPLVSREKLQIGVHKAVEIGAEAVIVIPTALVILPRLRHSVSVCHLIPPSWFSARRPHRRYSP